MSDSTSELKYPKQVFLIFITEFSERFCYYGLRTLLVLFIRNILLETESHAILIYHVFSALAYAFPVFGAIIADSRLGKYKTIIYFSIIYVIGTTSLSLSTADLDISIALAICIISLVLIAAGTGGIKPCVSSFGGDQFVLPQQQKALDSFFYFFYFSINVGSALSTVITPVIRKQHCFGKDTCYPFGFGIPALFMTLSLIVFVSGQKLYRIVMPEMNVIWQWLKCIGGGIKGKIKSKTKTEHWLDHSKEKFGAVFVDEVKQSLHVLVIFIPAPLFWALFDQTGSGWTLQASLMDGNVADKFNILPEQMITANSVFIVILIPIFTFGIYPLCAKCNLITTPLQRMACGGITIGISFFMAAAISLRLEAHAALLPSSKESHIRIYNPNNCNLKLNATPYIENLEIKSMGYELLKLKDIEGKKDINYEITGCAEIETRKNDSVEKISFGEKETVAYFLSSRGFLSFKDDVTKHLRGNPKIRTLVGNPSENLTLTYLSEEGEEVKFTSTNFSLHELHAGIYTLEDYKTKLKFQGGGVYTVLVTMNDTKIESLEMYEVTPHNDLHILWQVPQYLVLTIGEVLFSPTGLEFAYTQAPISMKSVMTSMWLLSTALGNVIVVIIESIHFFKDYSSNFFLYGGLMCADMGVFAFLATRYKYVQYKTNDNENAT